MLKLYSYRAIKLKIFLSFVLKQLEYAWIDI